MGGSGQLPQHMVPALLAKLAEARKFKSNLISFLAPLLRNTPMKIYFVLTRYQSNARSFFPLPSSGIPHLFFLSFLQSHKSQEEPAGLPQLLAAAFWIQAHLLAANKTCQKEPPAALRESKLEVQVVPGGWFCNQPATSFLFLSLFIQQILPIPTKPNPVILQGFHANHLLKY